MTHVPPVISQDGRESLIVSQDGRQALKPQSRSLFVRGALLVACIAMALLGYLAFFRKQSSTAEPLDHAHVMSLAAVASGHNTAGRHGMEEVHARVSVLANESAQVTAASSGAPCDREADSGCPMAKCAGPESGCRYLRDLRIDNSGLCCPLLCNLVCPGTPCEQEAGFGCPRARCTAPEPGCRYARDLRIDNSGLCCPLLCNLVC